MKNIVLLILCLMLCHLTLAQRVKIIFDTDMDSDVDDVGALAMLHGFASLGEAEILAVMVSSLNPWSPGVVDVINTYYGRPDIPIGAVQRFGVYNKSRYARRICGDFKPDVKLGEDMPEATTLYRKILSSQPDSSVVVVTVGDLTNLSKLLDSEADQFSQLKGIDLVKKKVKHLVCMGGRYPADQDPRPWGNFKTDPRSTQHVAAAWPTCIYFTGGGAFADSVPTGKIFFNEKYKHTPMAHAYKLFLEGWKRNWHHSADIIAVYVAVRGHLPYFKLEEHGYNHIFENGTNLWRLAPNDERHYLVSEFAEGIDPKVIAEKFDLLMVMQKKEK
ncbi:nucleoside hydrolase [Chitinophaga niabensis]|uniref:Inosine-uridine preferring nucleoside hydrolase n=1 Tax=Chitinophaga niabensis TaxID=536979 RepID=A0A1N6ERC4_9BACT|nr:nucleoside hydrolase [Chitinophaga niabensis]SIN85491.1 Inosine-uridine preferring nucleoside hydrolase [Chitinophaga niabensis]